MWPTLTRSRSRTLLLTFSAKSEVLEIMVCKCWASLITSWRLGLKIQNLGYSTKDFTLSYQNYMYMCDISSFLACQSSQSSWQIIKVQWTLIFASKCLLLAIPQCHLLQFALHYLSYQQIYNFFAAQLSHFLLVFYVLSYFKCMNYSHNILQCIQFCIKPWLVV